jgi:cytochrome oxidase Cu insertion factor (SCO1/SenC/PrrC family)
MHLLFALILLALALAACAPQAKSMSEEMPAQEAMPATHEPMATTESMPVTESPMSTEDARSQSGGEMSTPMAEDTGAMQTPAWFSVSLTDARSGEVFTVNDFSGKVVLVEPFAQWCSNCLKQQGQVLELHTRLGDRDDFITLALDIDPNEDIEMLKGYLERNGFHWVYTIAPPEVSREIASLYGDQFLNPPSTPMLIIDRHGEAHLLPFGIKSASELEEAIKPFLDEGM